MFDFEKLDVYGKAKELNKEVLLFLKTQRSVDSYIRDQLRKASISMVINIVEGSGKFSKGEKRNFYTIARGLVYECVSLFDLIKEENSLSEELFRNYYLKFETISKMLMGLIKSQTC